MNARWNLLLPFTWLLLLGWPALSTATESSLSPEHLKFFEEKIRPVLVRECYGCHSNEVGQIRGGLWLDSADGMRTGGDSGPAVVPGDLNESLLWNALNHADLAMPPNKKLSETVLADFKTWIEMEAPDPRVQLPSEIRSSISPEYIEQGRQFWSFQKPNRSQVPRASGDWGRNEIDEFVWDKLASFELEPSRDAEPTALLRRLYFDLIGLPPSPQQVQSFNNAYADNPETAIIETIDWLLDRPAFGERWARHWLDVARYAESTGREPNLTFPQAWRYRDYVIRALNQDKPYDRFLQEQLAGDLLPVGSEEDWTENLVATGFLAIGPKALTEQNARQFEWDLVDEQIDVTTRVMLGLSVSCARCHDHKLDPIPQSDYYALAGIFRSTSTHYGTFRTLQNRRPSNLIEMPVSDLGPYDQPISSQQLEQLKAELADKQRELSDSLMARRQRQTKPKTGEASNTPPAQTRFFPVAQLSTTTGLLQDLVDRYDAQGQPLSLCMGVQDMPPVTTRLLERGEFNRPAQVVRRGFPQVLCSEQPDLPKDSSGRLELARWISSPDNPLTARVMVNRIWQHLMGQGIVRSSEDFGATGQPPSHPELLDFLAVDFMEHGWSVKQAIRTIAASRTYRMSSQFDRRSFEIDPENHLLWRREPKRLDAESIRDAMLAISGNLELTPPRASLVARVGSATVRDGRLISSRIRSTSFLPDAQGRRARYAASSTLDERFPNRPGPAMEGNSVGSTLLVPHIEPIEQRDHFRSVYLPIIRDNVPRSLSVFDFAESTMVIGKRDTSSTPDQGLYFLNNPFVIEQAEAMAGRIMEQALNQREQIKLAFQLAYSRLPSPKEIRLSLDFYRSAGNSSDKRFALSQVCQAIMASAEFRYLD